MDCWPAGRYSEGSEAPYCQVAAQISMSETLHYITDEHGERSAVVLPIAQYEKLLEDLDDLAAIAERREETVVPHDQFIAGLKRNGLL
jgi:hypothetical protein